MVEDKLLVYYLRSQHLIPSGGTQQWPNINAFRKQTQNTMLIVVDHTRHQSLALMAGATLSRSVAIHHAMPQHRITASLARHQAWDCCPPPRPWLPAQRLSLRPGVCMVDNYSESFGPPLLW